MTRILLALVALALGAVLAYQWMDWPPTSPAANPQAPASVEPTPAAVPDPWAKVAPPQPLETYAVVAQRTLFRPQRRPAEPPPEEPQQGAEPEVAASLDAMDLSAVVLAPGVSIAWVTGGEAQELKPLRLGDELEGWAVKEILADRVVLERQGERNQLLLRDFTKAPPPVPPIQRGQRPSDPATPKPTAQRPRPPQTQGGEGPPPGADRGVAPPRPPQVRPNVRRPVPTRP